MAAFHKLLTLRPDQLLHPNNQVIAELFRRFWSIPLPG
jgi:hypothetical protein